MLNVLVSTISNSKVFLYSTNTIFNDQSFNDTLTYNIISLKKLGPEDFKIGFMGAAILNMSQRMTKLTRGP